jgi:hypothetical protein
MSIDKNKKNLPTLSTKSPAEAHSKSSDKARSPNPTAKIYAHGKRASVWSARGSPPLSAARQSSKTQPRILLDAVRSPPETTSYSPQLLSSCLLPLSPLREKLRPAGEILILPKSSRGRDNALFLLGFLITNAYLQRVLFLIEIKTLNREIISPTMQHLLRNGNRETVRIHFSRPIPYPSCAFHLNASLRVGGALRHEVVYPKSA